jgi:hypothetical protein
MIRLLAFGGVAAGFCISGISGSPDPAPGLRLLPKQN